MYAEDLGIKRIGEDITRNEDRKTKLNHDKDTGHNRPDQRRGRE